DFGFPAIGFRRSFLIRVVPGFLFSFSEMISNAYVYAPLYMIGAYFRSFIAAFQQLSPIVLTHIVWLTIRNQLSLHFLTVVKIHIGFRPQAEMPRQSIREPDSRRPKKSSCLGFFLVKNFLCKI